MFGTHIQACSMRQYQERVKRLLKRERKTTRKLKELGIEYDFPQYVSRCKLLLEDGPHTYVYVCSGDALVTLVTL